MSSSKKTATPELTHTTYQMLWDCNYCGTKKLLGLTHRFCPNCGAAQADTARYFPAEEDKIEVKQHRYSGADRICAACQTPNSAKAEFCTQCGAPLSAAAHAKRQADQVRQSNTEPPRSSASASKNSVAAHIKSSWKWGLALSVFSSIILAWWLWPGEKFEVVGHSWKHQIHIQQLAHFSAQDWCDNVPTDAEEVAREQRVRTHKDIPDHYRCTTWCDEMPAFHAEDVVHTEAVREQRQIEDGLSCQAWCVDMPSAAHVLSRNNKVKESREVKTGEDCNVRQEDSGDGTFKEIRQCTPIYTQEEIKAEYCHFRLDDPRLAQGLECSPYVRSEPVYGQQCQFTLRDTPAPELTQKCDTQYRQEPLYADHCHYRQIRWGFSRVAQAGARDREPYWPEVNISRSGDCLGCEREGKREAHYYLHIRSRKNQQDYQCEVPENLWRHALPKSVWRMAFESGNVPRCDTLQEIQ
jgi:ribosomal protein S27AE